MVCWPYSPDPCRLDLEAGWNLTSASSGEVIFRLNRLFILRLDERSLVWAQT